MAVGCIDFFVAGLAVLLHGHHLHTIVVAAIFADMVG
jgi:hypothetical protein